MSDRAKTRLVYGMAAAIVFFIEVTIALFLHDRLVRPYIGDVLAVVLVYLALRAVTPWPVVTAIVSTLAIAAAIEFGQYFHLLDWLGLSQNHMARVVLGGVFDLKDFACYFGGAALVLAVEAAFRRHSLFTGGIDGQASV
jgi:hypothetical protein